MLPDSLPDLLPIKPFRHPVRGEVLLPGSKSLTNRALLLAALCREPVLLTGALFSEDTRLMAEALRRLGFRVEADEAAGTARVEGQENALKGNGVGGGGEARDTQEVQAVELFVGLAGTAARFLTALCAAARGGVYRIDGIAQMRKRPMRGLIEALRTLGADIRCTGEEGFFPIEIHARGLRGGPVTIDASESSQMLSAVLMVAPLADAPVEVTIAGGVRWPFVQMTTRLMEHFGQPAVQRLADDRLRVVSGHPWGLQAAAAGGRRGERNAVYAIEPDATAASYFLALPLVTGGELDLPGLRGPGGGLQGDTRFVSVLQRVGAVVTETEGGGGRGLHVAFSVEKLAGGATAGGTRTGVTENFNEFSDTFLTLAAIAPLLDGPTRISGIAHTRKQETDRVAGMARELRRLGQQVIEEEDSLEIHPRPLLAGQEIETYGDHRFAMSFGILGCHDLHGDGRPWLSIKDPACCAKTFPHFFELLESLRKKSSEA